MPELTVRLATSADAALIAGLRDFWDEESGVATGIEFVDDLASWMDAHRSHHCVLAEVDGCVVGMAWLAAVDRVPRPGRLGRLSGDIQSVYVLPDARRLGAGAAMMRALNDLADSLGLEHETVHASAAGARLYESTGFVVTPRLLLRKPEAAGSGPVALDSSHGR